MECSNPSCVAGEVPIIRLQHGVTDIHGFNKFPTHFTEDVNPKKNLPSSQDKAPCPDCKPKERAEWERREAKKSQKESKNVKGGK